MSDGSKFHPVIGDSKVEPSSVTKVVYCSGKLYYDLVKQRLDLIYFILFYFILLFRYSRNIYDYQKTN